MSWSTGVARIRELPARSEWRLGLTTDRPGSGLHGHLHDARLRHHAEIRHAAGNQYRIVDLGSTHGTYVGAQRASRPLLHHGDGS